MKLNQLSDNPKAKFAKKRRGLGIGSGLGKTSGRGHKGYKSRSGASLGSFEGGQTPIHMRLPKRGFSNRRFAKTYAIVNLGRLQQAIDKGTLKQEQTIDAVLLKKAGIIRHIYQGVRVLAKGELKTSLQMEVAAASQSAIKAIQLAGGKINILTTQSKEAKEAKQEAKEAKQEEV